MSHPGPLTVASEDIAGDPEFRHLSSIAGAPDPQPHDDPDRLAAPLGDVAVRDHRVFAGKLDPADLTFGERLIAKVVRAPSGDFRDWGAVRAWAREIGAALAEPRVAAAGG